MKRLSKEEIERLRPQPGMTAQELYELRKNNQPSKLRDEEAKPVSKPAEEAKPVEEAKPAVKKTAAKRTTAKKTAAKKTAAPSAKK